MTSWSSSIKICCCFFKLIECIIKKKIYHGVKRYAKICAIGEQKLKSLSQEDKELIRRERRDGGEGEERGQRQREK